MGDGSIRAFGKCLDVADSAGANNTPVQLYTCNNTGAQQWMYRPSTGALVNPESRKCLDVPNGNTTDGTRLIIYTCAGSPNQRWTRPS